MGKKSIYYSLMITLFVSITLSCLTDYDCGYVGQCDWFECKCPEGVSGISCEINPCGIHRDPREQQPILHGAPYITAECGLAGKCVRENDTYKCVCEEGFGGDTCEMKMCSSPADCNGQLCDSETGVCVCEPGFNKGDCSIPTCAPVYNIVTREYHYCGGSGSCIKASEISGTLPPVRYYCDCNKGFSGHSCENYDCTDGLFVCTNDKHTCDRDTKQCKCKPHHYGPDCSKNPCSILYHDVGSGIISQCNDRGTCRDDGPDNAICDCDEGWVGSDCSLEDCVVNPSVCIAPLVCDQTLRMCICPGNHIGQSCNSCRIGEYFAEAANSCAPYSCISDVSKGVVCSGHGTCTVDTNSCSCSEGTVPIGTQYCIPASCLTQPSGDQQTYSLKNICSGHGACELIKGTYTCKCLPNYAGSLCQENPCQIVEFTSSGVPIQRAYIECNGGGSCSSLKCHCRPGYTGSTCELFSCNGEDSFCNDGECVQDPFGGWMCNCPVGSDLTDCSRKSCGLDTLQCSGSGACVLKEFVSINDASTVPRKISLHRCVCSLHYKGLLCQHYNCDGDSANCNGGICTKSGECTECPAHFYGQDCKTNPCGIDILQGTECSGNGVCRAVIDSTTGETTSSCKCNQGWFGDVCNRQTCPTVPCEHGGECILSPNGNRCNCSEGFSGVWCQDCVLPFETVVVNGIIHCVPGSCIGTEGYCSGHGHCSSEQSCSCDHGYTAIGTNRCVPDSCIYRWDGIISVCGLQGNCVATENGAECACSGDTSRKDDSSGLCMPANCFSSSTSRVVCRGHGSCNIIFDSRSGVCMCNNGFTNDSGTCTLNAKAAAGIGVAVVVLVVTVVFIILWFTVIKKKLEERKRRRFDGDSVRLMTSEMGDTSQL